MIFEGFATFIDLFASLSPMQRLHFLNEGILMERNIYDQALQTIQLLYGEGTSFREGQYEAIRARLTHCRTLIVQKQVGVSYLAYSLIKRIRNKDIIFTIQNGQLLSSVAKPDMGFTARIANICNRYICAQSEGTVVVRSDYKKGGTWSSAVDCIKHEICLVFCWDQPEYKGN